MNIEILAVNVVERQIAKCENLVPDISKNDRTPLTDGYVDVYNTTSKRKTDIDFRVSVQVKGRSQRISQKNGPIKYAISRVDLGAYIKVDDVLIFFLVLFDKEEDKERAYYSTIYANKVRALLENTPINKKNVSLTLQPFPEAQCQIEAIFHMAHFSKLQNHVQNYGVDSLLDVDLIEFKSATPMDVTKPMTLDFTYGEQAAIATTKDGFRFPLSGVLDIIPPNYVDQPLNKTVTAGSESYISPVIRLMDSTTARITLGPGIHIDLHKTSGPTSLSIKSGGNFHDQQKALRFFLEAVSNQSISIGSRSLQLAPEDDAAATRMATESLDQIQRVCALFDALHVDAKLIDPRTVTTRQFEQLLQLHTAIVGEELISQTFTEGGRVRQPVGDFFLELLCQKDYETSLFQYQDLFSLDGQYLYAQPAEDSSSAQTVAPVTAYELCDADDLPKILNLNLPAVVDRYRALPQNAATFGWAVQMVLKLIQAGDACSVRSLEFLGAAINLCEWLIEFDPDTLQHQINRWQILARLDALDNLELGKIRSLRDSGQHTSEELSEFFPICFATLLKQPDEALYYYEQLSQEERSKFEEWPMFTLYQQLCTTE